MLRKGQEGDLEKELEEDLNQLTLHDQRKGKEQIVYLEEIMISKVSEGQYHQKRVTNRLYNMKVTFEIPEVVPFSINAILDTGASICCIDRKSIPDKALEQSINTIMISGVNSKQTANLKLRGGYMKIGESKFRIPFTYSFDMTLGEGIQMLLGCNFIRSVKGGVRIEGNNVTFYNNITSIVTNQAAAYSIEELQLNEYEYMEIQEQVCYR